MNNQNTFYNSGIVFRNNYEFVKNICCHYKTFKVFFPNIKSIEKINNDYEEEDNGIFNEEQDFLIKLKSNNKYNFPSELKFKVCKTQLLKTQRILSFFMSLHRYRSVSDTSKTLIISIKSSASGA